MSKSIGHDNDRRLAFLCNKLNEVMARGEWLSTNEHAEFNRLSRMWNEANDPINNPPADASMLLHSGEE